MVEDHKTHKDNTIFNIFPPPGLNLFMSFRSKGHLISGGTNQLFYYDTIYIMMEESF